MLPPHPHVSLPTPQYFTFQGLSRPFRRLSVASVESVSDVMYSTQSIASWTVPLPTLMLMYGSAPINSHRSMNSWVPNAFVSMTPDQLVFRVLGRLSRGPIPSRQ